MPSELIAARLEKAEAVRLERLRRRLSQDQVGRMCVPAIDQPAISRAELGAGNDTIYEAIASALGIELPEVGE